MEDSGLKTSTILDVYIRVGSVLGFRRIAIEGGAAVKLLVNENRVVSDVDISTDLSYSHFRRKLKALELDGFKFKLTSAVQLIDGKTQAELDFGYKTDFGANVGYLGLTHKEIVSKAVAKKFNYKGKNVGVLIMSPKHLLNRKLQLLMSRGRNVSKRKRDKEDIISILNKFY